MVSASKGFRSSPVKGQKGLLHVYRHHYFLCRFVVLVAFKLPPSSTAIHQAEMPGAGTPSSTPQAV